MFSFNYSFGLFCIQQSGIFSNWIFNASLFHYFKILNKNKKIIFKYSNLQFLFKAPATLKNIFYRYRFFFIVKYKILKFFKLSNLIKKNFFEITTLFNNSNLITDKRNYNGNHKLYNSSYPLLGGLISPFSLDFKEKKKWFKTKISYSLKLNFNKTKSLLFSKKQLKLFYFNNFFY